MNDIIYQLTIKEDYASAIIEDLRLKGAIEILPTDIPQWQINETRKRIKEMNANPDLEIDGEHFFESIVDDKQ